MVRFRYALLILAFGIPTSAGAAPLPWEWTNEERFRVRTDPASRAERVDAYMMKVATAPGGTRTRLRPGELWNVLDGSANPELFFPTELFQHFVVAAYGATPHYRSTIASRSPGLFQTEEDWQAVEQAVAPFLAAYGHESELLRSKSVARRADHELIDRELAAARLKTCVELRVALTRVRKLFPTAFDKFLYNVVAQNLVIASAAPPDGDHLDGYTKAAMRREGGCQ